jgi:hypothetical protein
MYGTWRESMKIRAVAGEPFHADGQTDGHGT